MSLELLRKGRKRILKDHLRRPRYEHLAGGKVTVERGILGDTQFLASPLLGFELVTKTQSEAQQLCAGAGHTGGG
jgi:hypothetical protein